MVFVDAASVRARLITQRHALTQPMPTQTETLARVLLPPAAAMAVLRIRDDRAHGAAQLAGWALDALNTWAGSPWGAGGDGSRSPRSTEPHWARERPAATRLRDVAFALATCRPAMATLRAAMARVVLNATRAAQGGAPLSEALQAAVRAEHERRALAAAAAEEHARALLCDKAAVVTLSLSSSVLRALCSAPADPDAPAKPRLRVTVCESRPLREGVTTAARCAEAGHTVELITDAAAGVHLDALAGNSAALVLVGADAITPSGGVINKVGTRLLALAAADARVPLYVIATTDKVAATDDAMEARAHVLCSCTCLVLTSDAPSVVGVDRWRRWRRMRWMQCPLAACAAATCTLRRRRRG